MAEQESLEAGRREEPAAPSVSTRPPAGSSPRWLILAPLIAVAGGLAGLAGSALQEMLRGGLLVAFVGAPMIEEALKPSGVYFLLAKYPGALRGRLHTAFLSALGGLTFGIIENILYLSVYYPVHSHKTTLVRWTAGLCLHTTASLIAGFGINARLAAAVRGEIPLFSANKRFFITAMAIHSAYNIAAVVLASRLR